MFHGFPLFVYCSVIIFVMVLILVGIYFNFFLLVFLSCLFTCLIWIPVIYWTSLVLDFPGVPTIGILKLIWFKLFLSYEEKIWFYEISKIERSNYQSLKIFVKHFCKIISLKIANLQESGGLISYGFLLILCSFLVYFSCRTRKWYPFFGEINNNFSSHFKVNYFLFNTE